MDSQVPQQEELVFTFGLNEKKHSKRLERGVGRQQAARGTRTNADELHPSRLALLLSDRTAVYSRNSVSVVLESIWLPSLLAIAYNVLLYVVIHAYRVESVADFMETSLTSEPRLATVGAVLGFLVAFATNQFVASNRELALYFAEICANLRSLAMLLALTRRKVAREMYGLKTEAVDRSNREVEVAASDPDDSLPKVTIKVLVSDENLQWLKQQGHKFSTAVSDAPDRQGKIVEVQVPEVALHLASVAFVIKHKHRSEGRKFDVSNLLFYHSQKARERFEARCTSSGIGLSATEALLSIVAEQVAYIDGLSEQKEMYMQRLVQRTLHLDAIVGALAVYRPPRALTLLFWTLWTVYFALVSVRDMVATDWPSVGLNLLYVVSLVGSFNVSRRYASPFDTSTSRTGPAAVSQTALDTETAVLAMFRRPYVSSTRALAAAPANHDVAATLSRIAAGRASRSSATAAGTR
jgi:hypothetical protein